MHPISWDVWWAILSLEKVFVTGTGSKGGWFMHDITAGHGISPFPGNTGSAWPDNLSSAVHRVERYLVLQGRGPAVHKLSMYGSWKPRMQL